MNKLELESYPPEFRHLQTSQNPNPNQDTDDVEPDKEADPIPDWGAFRLINHGIPLSLLSQLEEQAKQLFSKPFEFKQASCSTTNNSPIKYFWGTPALTPSGATTLTHTINLVEGFNVFLAQLSQFQPHHHQLPLLESFRVVLVEYGKHVSTIATTLFDAMVKNLDLKLDPSKRSSYISQTTGNVRVYRYPPCFDAKGGLGLEAHTDSSVVSILAQHDTVSGLQFLRHQRWLTLNPIPNTLIVNIGDMMQAISEDRYKSARHRVKLKVKERRERVSICYFVFPDEDVVIENCKYKPFTYSHFRSHVQNDINTLGFKVGLPRFIRPSTHH
ncbi:Gibberellin 2-beta-dioxygenase 8 [Senna tora]|uniref:Gibberellin 2-beta-dioxygenase 8 n=1 Tax=Senna tora TaxID=362788 RepID=A0A834T631_9FABA|nr:Gibberellin 2-beta-dioxygenase 8 [Senna tora]